MPEHSSERIWGENNAGKFVQNIPKPTSSLTSFMHAPQAEDQVVGSAALAAAAAAAAESATEAPGADGASDAIVEIENVRVVVRVRPMDQLERSACSQNIVQVDKVNRCISVSKPPTLAATSSSSSAGSTEPPKVYYFDSVFGEESSQVSGIKQLVYLRIMI